MISVLKDIRKNILFHVKKDVQKDVLFNVKKYDLHSKKSLSIVKLRSFQNASIEIKHISFVYRQNLFPVTKLIYEMQKKNIFSNERFFLTLKRNPLIM